MKKGILVIILFFVCVQHNVVWRVAGAYFSKYGYERRLFLGA